MDDLISREDAINAIYHHFPNISMESATEILHECETAGNPGDLMVLCEYCDLKPYCIARLNDRTVRGCGMSLYYHGLIKFEEIRVLYEIKEKENER